jgi:Tfp pilus assembly protein PilF
MGILAVPFVLASLCSPLARCQSHATPVGHGRQVEVDVTIRDSFGGVMSEPANVELFLNGTPCDQRVTSNGRVSFLVSDIGKFTAVVSARGYKPGQSDVSVSEPVKVELVVSLQPVASDSSAAGATDSPLLAPKAKEALERGIEALREEKLDVAEKALDQASGLAPNHPQVLYEQGILELRKHDWGKAQSALEKATQMQPNSARALAALGMALCNQRKYAEAIPPLERSLALDPGSGWQTIWSLGESYYHRARFPEALEAAQQAAAESSGQQPQVDLLLARALTAVGRYEDSAKVLRELVKNHGDLPEGATARRFLERLTADGKIGQPSNP